MINDLYKSLFEQVVEDDVDSQIYYLKMVEDMRHIPVGYLLSVQALFIPNNKYITHYLGDDAFQLGAGLYVNGKCPWTLCVVIPIKDLSGKIVGLVGWDAWNKYQELTGEDTQGLPNYRVSSVSTFDREKYFLSDVSCLKNNFNSRVIFVVDGVFDALTLSYRGIPSISLLGSSVSKEVLYFLGWYQHIYVIADNDSAGSALFRKLQKSLHGVYCVRQPKTKDIEELLRSDEDNSIASQLKDLVRRPVNQDVLLFCGK